MMRAALLVLAFACASAGAPLNEPFSLAYGETLAVRGTDLTLTLVDVSDSRCPRNVNCVWEGEVTVELRVNDETVNVKVPGTARVGGYTIEVREVSPYPEDPPRPKSEYKATVVVTR